MRKPAFFPVALLILACKMLLGCATSSFEYRVHNEHLCPRDSAWYSAKNMTLTVCSGKAGRSRYYDMRTFGNGDFHLLSDNVYDTTDKASAEAILIGGRILLTRNITMPENYAIDVLDNAVLSQALAFTLIDLSSEMGPQETTFPVLRKMTEAKYPILVTTPSARALYGPPWEATIDIIRRDSGVIEYNIDFSFTASQKEEVDMKLSGRLSNYGKENSNAPLPDTLGISGWQQYNIGPVKKRTDKGVIVDYCSTYLEQSFSTLGELRKYAGEKYRQ